jgi:tRNA(fMet)-specific endonuclease VapC
MDTSVAIELIRKRDSADPRISPDATLFVPTTVFGELFHGAFNAKEVNNALREVEDFAAKVKILSCDYGVSRWYGQIRKELWRKGTPIPENDIWIASVAFTHGLPVLTSDQHFRSIEHLDVVDW